LLFLENIGFENFGCFKPKTVAVLKLLKITVFFSVCEGCIYEPTASCPHHRFHPDNESREPAFTNWKHNTGKSKNVD